MWNGRIASDRRERASWRQETIYKVADAWPHERGGAEGRALSYGVRLANGSTAELHADTICERLVNEHHERIVLTVDRAAHVLARHMPGAHDGAFAEGLTLTRLLCLFRRHCHERLGFGEEGRRIGVRCEQVIGTSGVASARELVERGLLSDDDLRQLAAVKETVYGVNTLGDETRRKQLIARVNYQWRARKIRLQWRGDFLLPAFIAPPQPTRSFVIMLEITRRMTAASVEQKRIRTMYPGEALCDSPAHASFMPSLARRSLLPGGATIESLRRKRERGESLSEREDEVLRAFRHAFEVWYEHGPLLAQRHSTRRPRRRRPKPSKPASAAIRYQPPRNWGANVRIIWK